MNEHELKQIINSGESSKVQFKKRMPHPDSIANELIAFSNSKGGIIIFGVNDKTGELNGLSFSEIQQINQQIVNIASQKVYPPVFLLTETVIVDNNKLIVVTIEEGLSKPYKDSNGTIYLKNGSDKRKVTSNDEIARLLQVSGSLHAEEKVIKDSSTKEIDIEQFDLFLYKKYKKTLEEFNQEKVNLDQILENLNLAKNGEFLLTGLLLFSNKRQFYFPQYSIQCVSVDGTIINNSFLDNEYAFDGTLLTVFQRTMDFIGRNMKKVPETNGFNSQTKWEIPYEVFEELIVNALVHRDYFINATIKIFIYSDRVEIISPGKLPNSLTVENIKNGVSVIRNNILLSATQYVLPYKGLGTGIRRSYSLYEKILMENDTDMNLFKVTIQRP
jgi:predicted HTH transcriptional regulator